MKSLKIEIQPENPVVLEAREIAKKFNIKSERAIAAIVDGLTNAAAIEHFVEG